MTGVARTQPGPKKEEASIGWLAAFNPRYWHMPSMIVLIIANLFPMVGVLFWGWDLFLLMMVYWAETGIIGFWGLVRLGMASRWMAFFYVPFFCVHFGGFMAGHLLFLFTLFADPEIRQIRSVDVGIQTILIDRGLWVALLALFISHGISFAVNFLIPWWKGLVPPDTTNTAMSAP